VIIYAIHNHQLPEEPVSVVVILILASLMVGLVFVGAFVWSVRSGQYEDTLTPSLRVLAEDAGAPAAPAAGVAVSPPGKKPGGFGSEKQRWCCRLKN
jgi:cbb3-type cytochrome oxidase maturation protein